MCHADKIPPELVRGLPHRAQATPRLPVASHTNDGGRPPASMENANTIIHPRVIISRWQNIGIVWPETTFITHISCVATQIRVSNRYDNRFRKSHEVSTRTLHAERFPNYTPFRNTPNVICLQLRSRLRDNLYVNLTLKTAKLRAYKKSPGLGDKLTNESPHRRFILIAKLGRFFQPGGSRIRAPYSLTNYGVFEHMLQPNTRILNYR